MFWGLIMEPNKRYTQVVEKPFHISQAAMDTSTGDTEPCQVMVMVDDKNYLICTLQKGKTIQISLDLYFKRGESITFLTNGKNNIHMTGYLDPEFEDEDLEDEEDEPSEEEETTPPAKNKRKLDNSNDATAAKKAKKDKKGKKAAQQDSDDESDSDEEENNLRKLLDGDVDSDENDESFKVNTSTEPDSEEESDDEEEEEEEEQEKSDEANTTLDTSKEESVDTSKLSKSQRRRLKKKLNQQAKAKEQPQVNGVDKTKKQDGQKAEKTKQEGKKDGQESAEKKEKKTLSGGVYIEDMKVGSGPVAKPGKTVMVYYEGRLKQNNKMFDNCIKGPGFKFRLGGKEVISGWDVGIAGMKVGGKRKIVCPPNMAYGAKGTPPVIPPNSTLVFEVELKNVK